MNGLPYLTPLGPDALAAQGVPPHWRFGMADRVRFSEIDALNHANHTTYLRWFEMLRVHYVRAYGLSPYDGTGPEMVLKSVEMAYHAPMHLDESYIAVIRVTGFRTSSFRMAFAVYALDCRAEGSALVVLLDRGGKGKMPIPAEVAQTLIDRDGAVRDG